MTCNRQRYKELIRCRQYNVPQKILSHSLRINVTYSDRNKVPDGKPMAEANRPYLCAKDLGKEDDRRSDVVQAVLGFYPVSAASVKSKAGSLSDVHRLRRPGHNSRTQVQGTQPDRCTHRTDSGLVYQFSCNKFKKQQ